MLTDSSQGRRLDWWLRNIVKLPSIKTVCVCSMCMTSVVGWEWRVLGQFTLAPVGRSARDLHWIKLAGSLETQWQNMVWLLTSIRPFVITLEPPGCRDQCLWTDANGFNQLTSIHFGISNRSRLNSLNSAVSSLELNESLSGLSVLNHLTAHGVVLETDINSNAVCVDSFVVKCTQIFCVATLPSVRTRSWLCQPSLMPILMSIGAYRINFARFHS